MLGSGAVSLNDAESDFLHAASSDSRTNAPPNDNGSVAFTDSSPPQPSLPPSHSSQAPSPPGSAARQRQAAAAEQTAYDAETARLVATAEALRAHQAPRGDADRRRRTAACRRRRRSARCRLHSARPAPCSARSVSGTEYIDVAWLTNDHLVGVRVDGIDLYDLETRCSSTRSTSTSDAGPVPTFSEGQAGCRVIGSGRRRGRRRRRPRLFDEWRSVTTVRATLPSCRRGRRHLQRCRSRRRDR